MCGGRDAVWVLVGGCMFCVETCVCVCVEIGVHEVSEEECGNRDG